MLFPLQNDYDGRGCEANGKCQLKHGTDGIFRDQAVANQQLAAAGAARVVSGQWICNERAVRVRLGRR